MIKQLAEIFEAPSKPFHVFLVLGITLTSASVIAMVFFLLSWQISGAISITSAISLLLLVAAAFLFVHYQLLRSNYAKRKLSECQSYFQAILLVVVLVVILFAQLLNA